MRAISARFIIEDVLLILLISNASSAEAMQSIVEVEKHLPWFWTPWPEGIRDVPYAYE